MTAAFYTQDVHGPFETYDLGDFELEQGGKIRNLQLAYATFGKLSPQKDNAILFPTWYSGSSKVLELVYLGPGRALDPTNISSFSSTKSATGSPVRRTTPSRRSTRPGFQRSV